MLPTVKRLIALAVGSLTWIAIGSCGGGGTTGSEPVSATTISLDSTSLTIIGVGGTAKLTATVLDKLGPVSNPTVAWTASPPNIVDLVGTGETVNITSKSVGTTTVQAKSGGRTATSSVTVLSAPVASLVLVDHAVSLAVGSSKQMAAQLRDSRGNDLTGRVITWTSRKTNFAGVNTSGLVDAKASGSSWVVAESEGRKDSAQVTVTPGPVATIAISPPSVNVIIGATSQLTATLKDAADTVLKNLAVNWSSSNTALATVGPTTGIVTGVAIGGPVTITAASGGKSATASVQVKPVPIATITLQPPSVIRLPVNQSVTFQFLTRDAAGNVISGSVAPPALTDPTVATLAVSGSGFIVTATKAGPTSLIISDADTSNHVSGTASITVVPAGSEVVITLIGSGAGSGKITSNASFNCSYSAGVETGTCSTTVPNGTMLTLTPSADAGSSFVWNTAPCPVNGVCTINNVQAATLLRFTFNKP